MTSAAKHGIKLLHDPLLNKSTAFTEAEKQALGLVGLVPGVTENEELHFRRERKVIRYESLKRSQSGVTTK